MYPQIGVASGLIASVIWAAAGFAAAGPEDIKQVTIKDNVLFVNGKPFVSRKLNHAYGERFVKDQGFNAVDCWGKTNDIEALLNKAHANGLYGYACLFDSYFFKGKYDEKKGKFDRGFDLEVLAKGVNQLKNHPALLVWEVFDEPDHNFRVPVEYLWEAYRVIKKLDPNHPVLLNFCIPENFKAYAGPADIVSMDTYPIPPRPVTAIIAYMDKLGESVAYQKPLQAFQQCWGPLKGRMPTPQELKCMTYLSINHGATLLAFYSYSETKDYPYCLAADKRLWNYMRGFNAELDTLMGVITAPRILGKVSCSNPAIDFSWRQVGDKSYLIAVNTTNKTVSAEFLCPEARAARYSILQVKGENRKIPWAATEFKFTDRFTPLAVHVYEFHK